MADDREDLPPTSRLPGFYRAPLAERREAVIGPAVPAELAAHLEAGGALPLPVADRMSENVIAQLSNIRTHPAVALALAQQTLNLHGWVYDIENGLIHALDGQRHRFVPLADNPQVRAS